MAQPQTIQKLKRGKALCGKTFGGFVDTFNWLVDFCLNLKGDRDADKVNGTVTVDRADTSAPVIRCTGGKSDGGGGGDLTVSVQSYGASAATSYAHVKSLALQCGPDSNIVFTGPGAYDETTGNLTLNIDVYYA